MTRLINCTSCPCFDPMDPKARQKGGRCLRKPPKPLMVGVQKVGLGTQPLVMAYFPGVNTTDVCFEHPMLRDHLTKPPLMGAGEAMPIPQQGNGEAYDVEVAQADPPTEPMANDDEVQSEDEVT